MRSAPRTKPGLSTRLNPNPFYGGQKQLADRHRRANVRGSSESLTSVFACSAASWPMQRRPSARTAGSSKAV